MTALEHNRALSTLTTDLDSTLSRAIIPIKSEAKKVVISTALEVNFSQLNL